LRIHPVLLALGFACVASLGVGAARAQSADAYAQGADSFEEETPTLSASAPEVVHAPPPATTAAAVQLAPVAFDGAFAGNAVPAGGFAEITPPAPKIFAAGPIALYASRAVASGSLVVNSGFGIRRDPFTGAARMHTGVDLKAAYGKSVGSALGGTVVYASDRGGYGNLVIVDHGRGIATMYGHLSTIAVSVGQRVLPGQTVGCVGSTGRSTGPHLHYEVRARGHALDPSSVITFKGKSVFANGRLVDGPTVEGGDEVVVSAPGAPKRPAPPPLPLFESEDGLSNS
jgi:murein DD-endopeptidase MepM/ murein hydrolase activator NlpD